MADNYTWSEEDTLGGRGRTRGSFVSTQHPRYTWEPESWEQAVRMIKPNGTARYTACFDKARKKKIRSVYHHWHEQKFPNDYGTITGIYTATGLSAAYNPTTSTGRAADTDTLYLKMTAADAKKFTADMLVKLQDHTYSANCVRGITSVPVIAGASSYLPVTLIEADDNYTASLKDASDADTVYIISSAMEEGDLPPKSIAYEHESYWNVTQILRTSLRWTRTAMQTGLRTPYDVAMAKRECLLMHQARKEKLLLWGIRDADNVGPHSFPARLTGGLEYFITSNTYDYEVDKTGTAWSAGGWAWLREICEAMSDYKGSDGANGNRRTVLCGQGAWSSLTTLMQDSSAPSTTYNITPMTDRFGGTARRFEHAGMELDFAVHPQMTYHPMYKYSAFFLEDSLIKQFYLQDDIWRPKVGDNGFDGQFSEFLWEGGFQIEGEQLMAIAHNFGDPGL